MVQALQGGQAVSREGVPIGVHVQDRPPPAYFAGRSTREATDELLQRLSLSPDALVVSSEPLRFKMMGPLPGPRGGLRPMAWPRDDHLLIAPFKVAVRRKDGRWLVASPREPFPNVWQRRILLWFVLSAAALAPLAYLFARRLARPIREFAAAAERLGRDPGAPSFRLRGPAEIQQAASAFNGMQDRLRRYVDDRTAMVGAVAHDLRTPLTRLRFRIEGAPDDVRDKVVADIDQMDAMISSALAFVRDATQPYERQRLELCSLVESVAVEMAETGLDVGTENAAPVVIQGDPVALRRLVTNLLDNAVKFGGCARARVYCEAGAAVIEVDDDGPGVPERERERVFEPFQRGEPSRSRETGGVGLGAGGGALGRARPRRGGRAGQPTRRRPEGLGALATIAAALLHRPMTFALRRIALLLLCPALAACVADGADFHERAGHEGSSGARRPLPNVFISPAGEPFRATAAGAPYPLADWFDRANAHHDGRLTREEFRADALRFFDRLDANRDGVIDGLELDDYEQNVAPEILPQIEALHSEEGMDPSLTYGDPNNEDTARQTRGRGSTSNRPLPVPRGIGVQGAAVYSMLNIPEPVAAADAQFDGRITRAEFAAAVDRRFDQLDKTHSGYLTLSNLPKTPLQIEIAKRAKQRLRRPQTAAPPSP